MDLELLLYFLIALVPGLFWLFVLALRYRSDRETRLLILKTFVLGMAICTPAGFFNSWLTGIFKGDGWLTDLLMMICVVGPNEESLKFLIVYSEVYRKWRFRTEMDGIIFATASAIGFATYENATYMQRFGIQVLYLRAWACVVGHLCFSAVFGYYLGLAKSKKYNPTPCIAEGLVLAALCHGSYNFLVGRSDQAIYVVVPCLVGFYAILRQGWLRPILSFVAPGWMAYRASAGPTVLAFQRKRFPVHERGVPAQQVARVLESLNDLRDETRLAGLDAASSVHDQRVYERVRELTHDPVEAVRVSAAQRAAEMKRLLAPT